MVVSTPPLRFGGLATLDRDFGRVLAEAERAAASEAPVLVLGETGTGKERLARAIHSASPRRGGPFVAVDCAALPRGLAEGELFGHRRGAFSGALRDRAGRLEAAAGGTVFFDGIDELEPEAQARLLRAVEAREVIPLGDCRPLRVDFRLIASAAPGIDRRVAEGRFRADLLWRLKVVELELVPLRRRRQDIPLLAAAFLEDAARLSGKPIGGFEPAALGVLLRHDWPGNTRELAGAVEAAVAAARGERVRDSDLPVHVRVPRPAGAAEPACEGGCAGAGPGAGPAALGSFAERVEEFQRSLLLEALGKSGFSHRDAAQELGLERHQLKYLCAKLGIRRSAADRI